VHEHGVPKPAGAVIHDTGGGAANSTTCPTVRGQLHSVAHNCDTTGTYRDADVVSKGDQELAIENERLRRENC
jgi:hypothetical protein